MRTITMEEVEAAIGRLDLNRRNVTTCVYTVVPDVPNCIAAAVMHQLSIPLPAPDSLDNGKNFKRLAQGEFFRYRGLKMEDRAVHLLDIAQGVADESSGRYTWGVAIDRARNALDTYV